MMSMLKTMCCQAKACRNVPVSSRHTWPSSTAAVFRLNRSVNQPFTPRWAVAELDDESGDVDADDPPPGGPAAHEGAEEAGPLVPVVFAVVDAHGRPARWSANALLFTRSARRGGSPIRRRAGCGGGKALAFPPRPRLNGSQRGTLPARAWGDRALDGSGKNTQTRPVAAYNPRCRRPDRRIGRPAPRPTHGSIRHGPDADAGRRRWTAPAAAAVAAHRSPPGPAAAPARRRSTCPASPRTCRSARCRSRASSSCSTRATPSRSSPATARSGPAG